MGMFLSKCGSVYFPGAEWHSMETQIQLEVFLEHIATPRGTFSAATINVTFLPMRIEQVLSRILCSCMVISKVWK